MKVKLGLFWIGTMVVSGLLGSAAPAWGHGATATVETMTTVRITSQYDTGEPIAQGQVAVYSPSDIETPWLTGTTDDAGVFEFIPNETTGNWEVVIRKAGHGQSITVALGADGTLPDAAVSPGLSAVQKGLTGLAVIWGFVGTALFFARRSPPNERAPALSAPHSSSSTASPPPSQKES